MIRLIVVEDHQDTAQSVISELSNGDIMEVIGHAQTTDEAWKLAEARLPDIILLDTHLPGLLSVNELLKKLTNLRRAQVIMYGTSNQVADVYDFLDLGAGGYVLKTDPPALLRMAVLMVARGTKNVLSPGLPPQLARLTNEERTILRHTVQPGRLPKIAASLHMNLEDLEAALKQMAEKLEVTSTAQVIKWAKKYGF